MFQTAVVVYVRMVAETSDVSDSSGGICQDGSVDF